MHSDKDRRADVEGRIAEVAMTDRLTRIEKELKRVSHYIGSTKVNMTGDDLRWMVQSLRDLAEHVKWLEVRSPTFRDGRERLDDDVRKLLSD